MGKREPIAKPEANLEPLDYKEQFQGRPIASKYIDPCEAASKASMKCLIRNDYEKELCNDYFQAYRDCKAAWMNKRKEDRRNGINVS